MHTIKTVETQVPILKESFFTTTFKGRRKSSITTALRKQHQPVISQPEQGTLDGQSSGEIQPHSDEKGQKQHTAAGPHRFSRSTSVPVCNTAERAGADGEGKEGQKERKDQRVKEAVHGRGRKHSVSGNKPEAVSASLLLPSSSSSAASVSPGEAASPSQPALTSVGRQRGLSSSGSTTISRGAASLTAQEDARRAQPRTQQYGLLAKGVRLLRNMGNQETKQKKASVEAAADVSCECDEDENEVDKKSKKPFGKMSKGKGESSSKKKTKSESKGSVFSGIRKSLSKTRGLSKDDLLEDGVSAHSSKTGVKSRISTSLSTDELEMFLDTEAEVSHLTTESHQPVMGEFREKNGSLSDADLYSFHSAIAENDNLLSEIQLNMKDQFMTSEVSGYLFEKLNVEDGDFEKETSQQLFKVEQEDGRHSVCQEIEPKDGKMNEEKFDRPLLGSSGSVSDGTPSPSAQDVDRSCDNVFPKTNSTYSFADTTATTTSYESAEEPLEDLESPVCFPQLCGSDQSKDEYVPCVDLEPVEPGLGTRGAHKSASSVDLSMENREEETGRRDFFSLQRKKNSFSLLLTDSPPDSQPRRTSSSSLSAVKLYPPVHPSYIKTTTRQLTSPIGSPITTPLSPRKTDATDRPVEFIEAQEVRRYKQRSSSIAGPISVPADWSPVLVEPRLPGAEVSFLEQTQEKGHVGGTYWTLGSRRQQYTRQNSTNTVPYVDVFSGETKNMLQTGAQ